VSSAATGADGAATPPAGTTLATYMTMSRQRAATCTVSVILDTNVLLRALELAPSRDSLPCRHRSARHGREVHKRVEVLGCAPRAALPFAQ
jgi:hypothetical protein